jgi:hypothetical protein
MLHHDNALPQTYIHTAQYLTKHKMAAIPHPLYSADLASYFQK